MADVEERPGVLLRVLAILGVIVLGVALGVAAFAATSAIGIRPWRYPGLAPAVSVSYAVVGPALGALAWALVRRRARRPRAVLAWSVGAVVGVSLGADVVAGADGRWLVGLVTAAQHAVVIAATVGVLCRTLPVRARNAVAPGWTATLGVGRRRVLAVGLVVAAAVWVVINKSVEGPTLLVITSHHGLTVADLFSVAALVAAGHLLRPAPLPSSATT